VTGYHGPALLDLSTVKGKKITPGERTIWREGGLGMYCGDNRHFTASCPRKLKADSGQVEINPFKENQHQVKRRKKDMESGNVLSGTTRMAIALDTNHLSLHWFNFILELYCFRFTVRKLKRL
jgi:hypothetical protein